MTKIWHAKETTIKVTLSSNITASSLTCGSAWFAAFGSAITATIKDVTIKEPMTDSTQMNLAGTDSNGFQNAELEEKPPTPAEISGNLILPGDESIESYIYDAGSAIAGTHTRYRPGKATIRKLAFMTELTDGTDAAIFVLLNVVPGARDTKLSSSDGSWETNFNGKCLARDFYMDVKD